ncbi:MAG: hypothetical protein GXX96_03870 [Planctomycetaceae bacterium]|jgi:hypothetical protein|nr:hypothetical protein [Planctomycetaceae bacterium]
MPDEQALIRDEIAGFTAYFGGLCPHGLYRHPSGFCHFGVPFRLVEWLDRPLDPAERKRFSRAAEAMEREGAIERVNSEAGSRTTHVRPRLALLKELFAAADDQTARAYYDALNNSSWGQPVLAELEDGTAVGESGE